MNKTELLMDKDLRAVVEFMQDNVAGQKLVAISDRNYHLHKPE